MLNKRFKMVILSLTLCLGLSLTPGSVFATTSNARSQTTRYNYNVPPKTSRGLRAGTEQVSGISKIKNEIYAAGGDDIAVAVAMLESKTMDSPDNTKGGDAANYTRFNMNWYGMRTKLYPTLGPNDAYKVVNDWKGSIKKETRTFMKYKSAWGKDFYSIHRGGESGLHGKYKNQIADYQDAIIFIANQLSANSQFKHDNTRVWVDVPYI
ncbi:lysozyme family protein [Anaerosacchariphilus polymeriproducens]|uniref:Mannosyl-glycoprotein endo-beta-N-acetylglucosamidase-like domain-containing protein n=1 Tax=Anaerosacchariphilus polymeriproducens TaxID=1812858 RepID=A0A371AZX3_9FIRM|nr:hypothetical protein [Anaerosacchariphilus polymeriproducens]RDU25144.1 hypothetical protein DWV06_01195 [Anaerosacchariphilus polymeriproducens]